VVAVDREVAGEREAEWLAARAEAEEALDVGAQRLGGDWQGRGRERERDEWNESTVHVCS
jgi:hypothetical protein